MSDVKDIIDGLAEYDGAEKMLDLYHDASWDDNRPYFTQRDEAERKVIDAIRSIIKGSL